MVGRKRSHSVKTGTVLLAAAGLGAAAVLGWNLAREARRRRERIEAGELRQLHATWLRVNGLLMHVRRAGPAGAETPPAVVMVHGWGLSSAYFTPLAERLATRHRVYAPDLPGHGLSDAPPSALDVDGLAEWLDEWMAAAGIRQVALIGHSMGCQVAVEAALRHPERVERLVLIGPTTDPAGRSTARQFVRLVAGGLFERPSLTWHAALDYWRMGRRLIPEFRAMLQDRMEGKLPLLDVPTLVVRGEHDPLAPQRWVDNVSALIETSSTAVIPGWGHAVQYSAAEQLAPVLEAFLERDE